MVRSYRFLPLIKKLVKENDFFITVFVTHFIKELIDKGLFREKNIILTRGFLLFYKDEYTPIFMVIMSYT